MLRRTILAALILAPIAPTFAQDSPSVRTLRTRSISFQVDKAIPEIFAHSAAPTSKEDVPGVPVKVKTYLNHEVEPLVITGDSVFFTTSADRVSIKEKEQVIAKAKIDSGFRSVVLMFLPGSGKAGSPPYRVLPIEDTPRSFPAGSFKVINLSPRPVRIVLEEKKKYDFKSGQTQVIEDPPVNDRNASSMRAFNFDDGQWQSIGTTTWPHPGEKRVIHVAFYNPASKKVEFRGIRDIAGLDPLE